MNASNIHNIAVIGTGTIGASWAAFFAAKGLNVTAYDPAEGAELKLKEYVDVREKIS